MGRYPYGACPSCGAAAHMCACGTMQPQKELPARIQRQMAGYQPRGFVQHGPQPPAYVPPGAPPQYPQNPPPGPPQISLNEILSMPQVQQHIQSVVEQALANYNPPPPPPAPAVRAGVAPAALHQLLQMSPEEVPGDPPKNNTGGRLNTYNKGKSEAVDYFKGVLRDILEASNGPGEGDRPAASGIPGYDQGAAPVPGGLPAGDPFGGQGPDGAPFAG